MAKTVLPAIDLASDRIVLEYVGGPVPAGVPARDLVGSDLGRQAYIQMLAELDHRAPDFERPVVTPARAVDVAAELVAGGSFRAVTAPTASRGTAAKPAAKPKPSTKPKTPPAAPATEPEA
jgi:hypothetical protein